MHLVMIYIAKFTASQRNWYTSSIKTIKTIIFSKIKTR